MLCPKCGAQVSEGSDFCQKCGTKLTAVSQARQPDNTAVNGPKKKKSKKLLVILVAIVLLIMVLLIANFDSIVNRGERAKQDEDYIQSHQTSEAIEP